MLKSAATAENLYCAMALYMITRALKLIMRKIVTLLIQQAMLHHTSVELGDPRPQQRCEK